MLGVALYVLVVTALLSVGAWLAERIMASLRWPRRGIWLAALALAVVVPAWRLPGALPGLSPTQLLVPAAAQAARPRQAVTPLASGASRAPHRIWTAATYEHVLLGFLIGWGVLTAVLIGRLIAAQIALRHRSRDWTVVEADGIACAVSEDLGPAVLGCRRPRIVIPRWVLSEPAPGRHAVLTHEHEHLCAHDGRCLLAARVLVALLPWNLPLWWLWRRLSLAIEVDCDARVVRRGISPERYGEALSALIARAAPVPRPPGGVFERCAQLGPRIRILGARARPGSRWTVLPLCALTGLAGLAAATFPAPPIDARMGARNQARRTELRWTAQRAQDARAVRRLVANRRPDALAAAAVVDAQPTFNTRYVHGGFAARASARSGAVAPLAWLRQAVAEAPSRPGLLILERYFCLQRLERCDLAAVDARLRALDPDNGTDSLDTLAVAVAAKNRAGIDAALAAIGRTNRVDTYGTQLFARLAETLHRIGAEKLSMAYAQVEDIRGQLIMNGLFAFEEACGRDVERLSVRRVSLCRNASLAFEHGDTFAGSEVGSGIAMRLWPAGTPEHRRAVRLRRRLDFMEEQSSRLMWPPGHELQTLLALYDGAVWRQIIRWSLQYPSEQDVLRAQLVHAGLPISPPPGWKDPYATK